MTAVAIERPVRVQRKRMKGWKMPLNTTYVGRPSKWGNPFSIKEFGNVGAVWSYERWLANTLDGQLIQAQAREELRGRNLACFCPIIPGSSLVTCHADILLKIANEEQEVQA